MPVDTCHRRVSALLEATVEPVNSLRVAAVPVGGGRGATGYQTTTPSLRLVCGELVGGPHML